MEKLPNVLFTIIPKKVCQFSGMICSHREAGWYWCIIHLIALGLPSVLLMNARMCTWTQWPQRSMMPRLFPLYLVSWKTKMSSSRHDKQHLPCFSSNRNNELRVISFVSVWDQFLGKSKKLYPTYKTHIMQELIEALSGTIQGTIPFPNYPTSSATELREY